AGCITRKRCAVGDPAGNFLRRDNADFTMYGGGFATIPAYLADLFGTKYVGGIHGRLLTAWSTAGVIGPWMFTTLLERSLWQAIKQLTAQIEPAQFAAQFGAPPEELAQ